MKLWLGTELYSNIVAMLASGVAVCIGMEGVERPLNMHMFGAWLEL